MSSTKYLRPLRLVELSLIRPVHSITLAPPAASPLPPWLGTPCAQSKAQASRVLQIITRPMCITEARTPKLHFVQRVLVGLQDTRDARTVRVAHVPSLQMNCSNACAAQDPDIPGRTTVSRGHPSIWLQSQAPQSVCPCDHIIIDQNITHSNIALHTCHSLGSQRQLQKWPDDTDSGLVGGESAAKWEAWGRLR
jgi:hypothetical protein